MKLLGRHLRFDAFQGRLEQVILPLPLPHLVKIILPFVRNLVDGMFLALRGVRAHQHGRILLPLAELVVNAPAGHIPEPELEGTLFRLVNILLALLGDGKNGLLHHVPGFVLPQSGLEGDGINKTPVRPVKLIPRALVLPILQARNQAFPGMFGILGKCLLVRLGLVLGLQ